MKEIKVNDILYTIDGRGYEVDQLFYQVVESEDVNGTLQLHIRPIRKEPHDRGKFYTPIANDFIGSEVIKRKVTNDNSLHMDKTIRAYTWKDHMKVNPYSW